MSLKHSVTRSFESRKGRVRSTVKPRPTDLADRIRMVPE
jgi:hypothetical protein